MPHNSSFASIAALLLLLGCIESNPQPSPIGGNDSNTSQLKDAAGHNYQDGMVDTLLPGSDIAIGGDGMESDSIASGDLLADQLDDIVPDGACVPNCHENLCGPDGCGGSCGECESDLQCLETSQGLRCAMECQPGTCGQGEFCLFGVCESVECHTDEECGESPLNFCTPFLHCAQRQPCEVPSDCWNSSSTTYCDTELGLCLPGGNCMDNSQCAAGSCESHWCTEPVCGAEAPPCPPDAPICILVPEDVMGDQCPEGKPCGHCETPCLLDSDCAEGLLCEDDRCISRDTLSCHLDLECSEGQYCHPGCSPLPVSCTVTADCPSEMPCIAGFCDEGFATPCTTLEECEAALEGTTCQDGFCLPLDYCLLDADCPPEEFCQSSACISRETLPACRWDADCPNGERCQGNSCESVPECHFDFQCPEEHLCKNNHCQNNSGVCAWIEHGPGFCDDGDACTQDSCDSVDGCFHTPMDNCPEATR